MGASLGRARPRSPVVDEKPLEPWVPVARFEEGSIHSLRSGQRRAGEGNDHGGAPAAQPLPAPVGCEQFVFRHSLERPRRGEGGVLYDVRAGPGNADARSIRFVRHAAPAATPGGGAASRDQP